MLSLWVCVCCQWSSMCAQTEHQLPTFTVQLNLRGLNCLCEDWQMKQWMYGTIWPDMKLDLKILCDSCPWAEWQAERKSHRCTRRRDGASYHNSSQSARLKSDFEKDFSNVCRCWHILSCFLMWWREEPVRLSVVKTLLRLHQARPNHTRRGS